MISRTEEPLPLARGNLLAPNLPPLHTALTGPEGFEGGLVERRYGDSLATIVGPA